MKKNVTTPGGLFTDTSPLDQPKNTVSFALNTVNETDEGNLQRRSVENSNEECHQLTDGYAFLGKVYIGNNEQLIFSVAYDESSSEIGIIDRECQYTALINHPDFGFKMNHQIDATYRLRRGCERTIYWVDPKPRIVNIDGLEDYKDDSGNWSTDAFNLFKTYSQVPIFNSFDIGEEGAIPAGSINFAVQYLDEDFNPTEFVTSSGVIKIYHDGESTNFSEIRGSTNRKSDYQDFGVTNKSVRITLSNLDNSYPFYRIAIIKSDGGTGLVTGVEYSSQIPTELPVYNYTGQGVTVGNLAEVQEFRTVIDAAEHIEQIENKLLLSNVKGKQINFCNLQKYASRIKSDVAYKEVILNQLSDSNPKSPTANIDGVGYMPGEIYSYSAVYVFDDGTTSPAYHIPGKAETYFSEMSSDNKLTDTFYTDNATCEDYWGVDSEGNLLKNTPVRHHRFPLRSEVNKPLVKKDNTYTDNIAINKMILKVSGATESETPINYSVSYESGSISKVYEGTINPATYDKEVEIPITDSTKEITVSTIFEDGVEIVDGVGASGLNYATAVQITNKKVEDNLYTAEIFGIEFSNVVIPDPKDTNGHKVIGYYIVRNERTEDNKTILDSGVVMPMMEQPYYVAYGHTVPNNPENIKQDAFALIHPEHKFLGKEYKNASELIQEGEFVLSSNQAKSSVRIQDVMAGTSYDPEVAKRREKDGDGFTLHTLTRDSEVSYRNKKGTFLAGEELDEIFYLDSLNSKAVKDTDDVRKEIFNVSGDNKIGAITSNIKKESSAGILPYIILRRNLSNPYSNFRYMPYYKQGNNVTKFVDGQSSSTTVFSGDAYITPMRYVNSFYYNIKLRQRATKSGIWNVIVGGLAVIAGALITVGTLGGGTALGIAVAGFGISQISSGVKKEQIAKVYNELYEQGLRDCIIDDDTKTFFDAKPPDDEIQWMSEAVTNLWFESSVNIGLRQGLSINVSDFLDAPAKQVDSSDKIQAGLPKFEDVGVFNKLFDEVFAVAMSTDVPSNELDSYILEKLTVLDTQSANGRLYQGFCNAEFYDLNFDYLRQNHEKIYNHLGIEYDCCSDCNEVFPQRTHNSETSFQEELIDNYRIFLPNNYRDIEGEKGVITNVFKIQNNLYIHTAEALWHLPQNIQERVTGDIVSFLGTGDFFSIPPRNISDAGTKHKWGVLQTKYGVLFPSIDHLKWYLFDGNQLEPITDYGNSKFFLNQMPLNIDKEYFRTNRRPYPFNDNPSSKFGIGFLSTYDSRNERFILTKKDYHLSQSLKDNTDYEICESNGNVVIFNNYNQIIEDYTSREYKFEGIDACRLKFTKTIFDDVEETRTKNLLLPNETDVHFFLDTSGSFGGIDGPELSSIRDAVNAWLIQFRSDNPEWSGNVYEYADKSERWLKYLQMIGSTTYAGQNLGNKDILVISFCNESTPYGNDRGLQNAIPTPTNEYLTDYNEFRTIHSQYKSFIGIAYPIVFKSHDYSEFGKALLQQSLAAIKGRSYTELEVNQIQRNDSLSSGEWDKLKNSLVGNNPYPDNGLEQFGWVGKWNRNDIESIITPVTFASDINDLLAEVQSTEEVNVTVRVPRTVTDYIPGEPLNDEDFIQANNSWTMSYSLKKKEWVGWHSYFPNAYMSLDNNFYAWQYGDKSLWKFNKKGHYLTFFGKKYPHIIEYVSKSNPLETVVVDSMVLQTEATQWVSESEDYVDKRFVTFNKLIVYNSRQVSGLLDMVVKDTKEGQEDYFRQQVSNKVGEITIDKNEQDWYINGFRDMRVNYEIPMFRKDTLSLQQDYYIDKVVNNDVVDMNKDWSQMESFRDKYLVVRLIFDNFDNIKLVTNFSIEDETPSER